MNRQAWIEVDLKNAAYDAEQIKARVADNCKANGQKMSKLIGVVKADSYGNGSVKYAKMLLEHGFDMLAVATVQEGTELRESGITEPRIIILGIAPNGSMSEVIGSRLTPVVSSFETARALDKAASDKGVNAECMLAVDSGMGRIGWQARRKDLYDESIAEINKINALEHVDIAGAISHLSVADESNGNPRNRDMSSDDYTRSQFKAFTAFCDAVVNAGIKIPFRTIANSAAIMDYPEFMLDAVRPGIILYGCYPSDAVNKDNLSLKPVMSVKAQIVHIKTVPAGTCVSYGRKFAADKESRIATLPLGYADGYSRTLTGQADVLIRGQRVPVVGSICMDQCMIDVTDVPEATVGDEVIIMGSDESGNAVTADELAEKEGTINYEVLCDFSMRMPRIYIGE